MRGPFEQIREQEGNRDCQPFQRLHIVDVLQINVERRRSHRIDDHDMQVAVIPAHNPRPVFLPEGFLSFGYH
jgi:hypothetical protein